MFTNALITDFAGNRVELKLIFSRPLVIIGPDSNEHNMVVVICVKTEKPLNI